MPADTIPSNIKELQALVLKQQSEIAELKPFKEKSLLLEEEVALLRKLRFAHKSEKWTTEDKIQAFLFDEAEEVSESPTTVRTTVVKSHRRKKAGRKALDPKLPRVELIHELSDKEKVCDCGHALQKIGEDSYEELDFQPAKYWVNKHIYPKYACKHCEGLSNENKPAVSTPPREPRIIEKSIATPGLLAYTLVSKFEDHLPFYRQEKIFRRLGVELPRATMCNWAMHIGKKLEPLLEIMKQDLVKSKLVAADETRLKVMKELGRKNTSNSFMWLFYGKHKDRPIYLYNYHPTRATSVVENYLQNYKGILLTDGYSVYQKFAEPREIVHAGCWAHARRKFKEAFDTGKQAPGVASKVIEIIQELYNIERNAKENEIIDEELLKYRIKNSKPIVADLYNYLKEQQPKVRPESLLGKAITYTLNQWPKLIQFLNHSILPLDNNVSENAIRPFVLGRKNWLFSGSPRGAHASCAIYSIIETSKANGLEPYWYLRYLFEKLPKLSSQEELAEIAPHRITIETLGDYKRHGVN